MDGHIAASIRLVVVISTWFDGSYRTAHTTGAKGVWMASRVLLPCASSSSLGRMGIDGQAPGHSATTSKCPCSRAASRACSWCHPGCSRARAASTWPLVDAAYRGEATPGTLADIHMGVQPTLHNRFHYSVNFLCMALLGSNMQGPAADLILQLSLCPR